MAASQTEPLLKLLECLLATRASAEALFAMADAEEANSPSEAWALRSIARVHHVRVMELEARLVALSDESDRLTAELY